MKLLSYNGVQSEHSHWSKEEIISFTGTLSSHLVSVVKLGSYHHAFGFEYSYKYKNVTKGPRHSGTPRLALCLYGCNFALLDSAIYGQSVAVCMSHEEAALLPCNDVFIVSI